MKNVKRYEAPTLQEALYQIKADLGPNASVLYVKEVKKHRSFRLASQKMVEVLAGVEDQTPSLVNSTKLEMIQYELREMKSFMQDMLQQNIQGGKKGVRFSGAFQDMFQHLLACDVEEEIAENLIKNLKERITDKEASDQKFMEEMLVKMISQMIDVATPFVSGNTKIVAFVGPTGVGKTTTVAKLAANMTLLEKKKVALITIDTYRIAAVEQLKTYAEIMGIPLDVVFTPKELLPALQKHKGKDLIFIDTAGRNPLNDLQMNELQNFIGLDGTIEVQLLISMTTKAKEIPEIFSRFDIAKINRLILTKMDEVTSFGNLLSAVTRARRPINYITTGQNVPEDIESADAERLARLVLARENPFVKKAEAVKK